MKRNNRFFGAAVKIKFYPETWTFISHQLNFFSMIPEFLKEKEAKLLSVIAVNGQLIITIDAAHAKGYYDFLKHNGINCTEPKPASFNVVVYDVDGKERIILKATTTFHIVAKGTENDWKDWTNKWIETQYQ